MSGEHDHRAVPTRITACWDGRAGGFDALALGRVLAGELDAELVVFHADTGGETERDLAADLRTLDAQARTISVTDRSPAAALTALDADPDAGWLVLGSTHRGGVGRVFPGATAERVLGQLRHPLAIAPRGFADDDGAPGTGAGLRVLSVGYDGSDAADEAVSLAANVAAKAVGTIRVHAVAHTTTAGVAGSAGAAPVPVGTPADLQDRLHRLVGELPSELRTLPVYEQGEPAQQLLSHAEEGVDLLVIGSHGQGRVSSVLLGSTARTLLRASPCPLLVVPGR